MPMLKRLLILLVIFTLLTTAAQAYYDPYIGRFTQRDPVGQGTNWYAYTYNNPLKFVDPTGMYIVLPDGTEIRSLSTLPSGLKGDEALIYDALFTGGINGTGIAGSKASGTVLKEIINDSDIAVEITFGPLSHVKGSAEGYTNPNPLLNDGQNRIPIEVLTGNKPDPTRSDYIERISNLRIILNHELSHAHNFITKPKAFGTIGTSHRIILETAAFRRDANLAWELSGGKDDWHVRATGFTYPVLQQRVAGNMRLFYLEFIKLVGYATK